MSLILDALKKSEAERQRQSGPTLLEVRISKPRRRYPIWVLVVGALLVLNVLLLLAFVLHRPASPAASSPPIAATGAAPAGIAASSTALPPAAPATTASNPAAMATPPTPVAADPALAPGALVPAGPGPASSVGVLGELDTMEPERSTAPQAQGAPETQDSAHNPADDEPALPAGTQDRNIPNFSDLSGADLPDLRLDLHVYAEHVRDRYALINMHRVHEGDTLPEGPRVLAITRAGVVLSYHGQDFTLRPQ